MKKKVKNFWTDSHVIIITSKVISRQIIFFLWKFQAVQFENLRMKISSSK